MRYWVLGRDNQPKGPYPGSHIMQGMAQGKVDPARMVCREGEQEWMAVRDVPELNGGSGLPEMLDSPALESIPLAAAMPEPVIRAASPRRSSSTAHDIPSQPYDKTQRVSIMHRRLAAYLFEFLVVLTVGFGFVMLFQLLFLDLYVQIPERDRSVFSSRIGGIAWWSFIALWLLCRDVVPGAAWGRRWFALRVVSVRTGDTPPIWARMVRNVVFIFIMPLALIVEYTVAYLSPTGLRRIGDRITGTQVIDTDPHGRGARPHTLWAVVALSIYMVPCCIFVAIVAIAVAAATAAMPR